MISVSNEFKSTIEQRRDFKNHADVTLANGTVLHLEPKDFCIDGNTIDDESTDGSQFAIGSAIAKTITMKIANNIDQFSQYDFYNARIVLYVSLQLSESIEKLKKGTYTVNEPVAGGSTIVLSAIDDMISFDKDYSGVTTTYPATLQTILSDVCLYCGVSIGFGQFDNRTFSVSEKPVNCTCRQIVAWVAQIAGYNARISVNNALELIKYDFDVFGTNGLISGGDFSQWIHSDTISGGDFTTWVHENTLSGGSFADLDRYHVLYSFKDLEVATDDVVITGVKVINEDTEYLNGTDDYTIIVSDNDLANGQEQTVANYLGSRFIGMQFRPFEGKHIADPRIEAGDVAYIIDRKGRVYQTLITDCSFTTCGYTSVSCNAESPIHNKSRYYSDATRAVAIARKDAEKQLSTYDRMVQNMGESAANAMGFYQEYEDQIDGSRITYMSNKPITKNAQGRCIFASGSIVYKQSSSGFFLSRDGGNTYVNGFDGSGNAVLNIVAAIGIVCDWIKGGTLTLGGFDNVNGQMQIKDASGNVGVTGDKNGIFTGSGNATAGVGISGVRQAFWAGSSPNNSSNAPFRVDHSGHMYCEGATIYGDITMKNTINSYFNNNKEQIMQVIKTENPRWSQTYGKYSGDISINNGMNGSAGIYIGGLAEASGEIIELGDITISGDTIHLDGIVNMNKIRINGTEYTLSVDGSNRVIATPT